MNNYKDIFNEANETRTQGFQPRLIAAYYDSCGNGYVGYARIPDNITDWLLIYPDQDYVIKYGGDLIAELNKYNEGDTMFYLQVDVDVAHYKEYPLGYFDEKGEFVFSDTNPFDI